MPLQKVLLQLSHRLLQVLKGHTKVSPQPSLLQAEQPQLSAFPHRRGTPARGSFLWPPLNLLQQVQVCPVLRAPELDAGLPGRGGGLTRAE